MAVTIIATGQAHQAKVGSMTTKPDENTIVVGVVGEITMSTLLHQLVIDVGSLATSPTID